MIYPILYLFVQPATGLRPRLVSALKDVAAISVGAAALVVALGLLRPSERRPVPLLPAPDRSHPCGHRRIQVAGYEWLRAEPRLLVPIFLVVVAAPLLAARASPPAVSLRRRFRRGAGVSHGLHLRLGVPGRRKRSRAAVLLQLLRDLDRADDGIDCRAGGLPRQVPGGGDAGMAVAATLAAVVPLGLIFRDERAEWTGRAGMKISVAVMAIAALLASASHSFVVSRIGPGAAVVAVGAVAVACHFAINSSTRTFRIQLHGPEQPQPVPRSPRSGRLREALDRRRTTRCPHSGTRPRTHPDFASIQSMYYFGYTALAFELPRVTKRDAPAARLSGNLRRS